MSKNETESRVGGQYKLESVPVSVKPGSISIYLLVGTSGVRVLGTAEQSNFDRVTILVFWIGGERPGAVLVVGAADGPPEEDLARSEGPRTTPNSWIMPLDEVQVSPERNSHVINGKPPGTGSSRNRNKFFTRIKRALLSIGMSHPLY